MPEGPECHYAGYRLEKALQNNKITAFNIHGGRYETHGPFDGFDQLQKDIEQNNHTVKAVGCRGKLIVIFFDNDMCLLSTLGLKGSWTTRHAKHCDVSLTVNNSLTIWFKDQMHYGTLKYVTLQEAIDKMQSLGPDVTVSDPAFTYNYLCSIITRYKRWDLAKLLMDQSKISGIGNYLKAEILYRAKLPPTLLCSEISPQGTSKLYDAIIDIPKQYFQQYLGKANIRMQVYGRPKDRLGYTVERCKTKDGRTSHWVPAIQTMS
jgi:formamidopyrimidine-DNA glycosylase